MRFAPLLSLLLLAPAALAASLDDAREHLAKGRYEEAAEAFGELGDVKEQTAVVALGRSRLAQETGEWDAAAKVIDVALEKESGDERLIARRAELHLLRGEFDEAEKLAARAIEIEPDQLLARWVQAEVLTETGRIAEADVAYRWFVRYYNRAQPKGAEDLMLVATGSLQYARWHSASPIFNFVVNDLCPDALKDDETSWRAWQVSGATLLEKFNRAQAIPEFESALAINPRAADVLVLLGEADSQKHEMEDALERANAALKTNPRHPRALRLRADVELAEGDVSKAIASLESALEVNPRDQRTLARLATCHVLADGSPPPDRFEAMLALFGEGAEGTLDAATRLEELVAEIATYNRRPGYFLADLGEALDARRKYALAEIAYRRANEVHDRLSEPKVGLGMLFTRVGRVDEARPILDAAFKADPYHVRVSNTRKVLRVLEEYDTIETPHFIVQFDKTQDAILGRQMAAYLEEIYPAITELYGFEPPAKTRFEIYSEHKGVSGHGWFSARMVGLPWVQTIGATTGLIVAFASPNTEGQTYNWAQVARHEFTHVVTLQQTEFNIPHWFTEALAVTSEGYPRPEEWNELLLERVPKRDLRTLDNLTDGFVRPESAADWQFAYCQSKLYADYMRDEYGDTSIRKLLAAYERNETTTDAVPDVFGVPLATFEAGYLDYLDKLVEEIRGPGAIAGRTAEEIEAAYETSPDDPATAAAYAAQLFDESEFDRANEIARAAVEKDPKQATAAVVVAKLLVRAANRDEAIGVLEPALDEAAPHRELLELLAKLKLAAGDVDSAARLYELGVEKDPHDGRWIKGLAAVHLKSGDTAKLREALTAVGNREADDAGVRKKLASLALDAGDFETAETWAKRAMHVTAQDPEVYVLRGRAFAGMEKDEAAREAFDTALELDPENAAAKAGLAALNASPQAESSPSAE